MHAGQLNFQNVYRSLVALHRDVLQQLDSVMREEARLLALQVPQLRCLP